MKTDSGKAALVIGAFASGSGKTSAVCALLGAFLNKGLTVRSAKCGPDYIDPMFHREVLGIETLNMDLFFSSPRQLVNQFVRHSAEADMTLIEGVMGYYDGRGMDTWEGSTYEVAKVCEVPAVLVVRAAGSAVTLAALIEGAARFQPDSRIRGVILNKVSPMIYKRLKPALEDVLKKKGLDIKVYGYLPQDPAFEIESRHLGLVTPEAVAGLKEKLGKAARIAEETVDIDGLYELAKEAQTLSDSKREPTVEKRQDVCGLSLRPKIGVARDEAFCFYYKENMRMLEEAGCQLIPFSPLHDRSIPEDLDGLLLGGGYPELYAGQLSQNVSMRREMKDSLEKGMPCLAECGGFLYLNARISDQEGRTFDMVGFFDGCAENTGKLGRFGYIGLEVNDVVTKDGGGLYLRAGEVIRGHEFHYWDCSDNGKACRAVKPDGRTWECGHLKKKTFAGFPHLAYWSLPEFAGRFAQECEKYRLRKNGGKTVREDETV